MIEGATKMPEPMTLPTMRVVASSRPRPRTSWAGRVAAALWAKALEYNPAAPPDGLRLRSPLLEPLRAVARGAGHPLFPLPSFRALLLRSRARRQQGPGAGQGPGLELHGSPGPEADQALQARGQLPGG